jgi:hypothetical protein
MTGTNALAHCIIAGVTEKKTFYDINKKTKCNDTFRATVTNKASTFGICKKFLSSLTFVAEISKWSS